MYSVTKNIMAAMHFGKIDPQYVIDRLEDRHKAKLPEVGLDKEKLLKEAKVARFRNGVFDFLFLIPTFWIINLLLKYQMVLRDEISIETYISYYISPIIFVAFISFFKTFMANIYIRKNIVGCEDAYDDLTEHNAVIFGGFSPFAGYGVDMDGWSFTIDTRKPKTDGEVPLSVNQKELLDHVSFGLSENMIEGSIQDKLFINGLKIKGDKRFLSNILASPTTNISKSTVASEIGSLEQDARHYRLFSLPITKGHIFLTFFYRASMVGHNLFVESRSFILPPIKQEFTELIEIPMRRGIVYHIKLFSMKLLTSPIEWLSGIFFIFYIVDRYFSVIWRSIFGHPEDKLKKKTEMYNYGNTVSLREEWASKSYQTYFQMLDKDMATKTFQHIIINSIVDYLDGKGVATDDIKERRTQIFNSGVIVSGGTVNAHQLAVGSGAAVKVK